MNDQRPTIAVCGATGQQGGAVLRHLEAQDRWNLRALSRNPDGDAARRIRERGIEVVRADLVDGDSLRAAFNGAAGVYGVTTPMSAKGKLDVELEMRQGRAIVDACADTGVGHLVLSTVLHIDDNVTVPYLKTKREIERYVIERGIPHTFLCPASFMDELGGEFLPVKRGVLAGQADGDAKIPYVACSDIGAFAALAFADPDRFAGRKLNLLGDFISGDDLAATLTRVGGRPTRHKVPPVWLMRIFAREWITLRRLFEGWGRPPHPVVMLDALAECRSLRPDTLDFERFVRITGWTPSA
jgi:uncharacterized protein YbjT (DUF2867 family)